MNEERNCFVAYFNKMTSFLPICMLTQFYHSPVVLVQERVLTSLNPINSGELMLVKHITIWPTDYNSYKVNFGLVYLGSTKQFKCNSIYSSFSHDKEAYLRAY